MIYTSKCKSWIALNTQAKIDAALNEHFRELFWKHVNKTDKCWLWTASIYKNRGYGRTNAKTYLGYIGLRTHRTSWMMHYGVIPGDIHVCHECDTPACVRPDHLYLASNEQNHFDKAARGRTRGFYGDTKLNDEIVRQIRTADLPDDVWAKRLDVHPTTIRYARTGQKWKHVDTDTPC